ncbi:MAG TPA: peptide chain release factor N(5)-glutamine methyltransferase [Rubrivivax sp.]
MNSTATPPRLSSLLAEARAAGVDRLDAQLLLAHHAGRSRTWVLAHDEEAVDGTLAAAFRASLASRAGGVPLAYLVGEREFHGILLRVTPEVLIPRPDTETLVDWALELLAGPLAAEPAPEVLDLGTGSGAVALAVKHRCPRARVTALDVSAAALGVAEGNAARLGLAIDFVQGDWFAGLGARRFDLVLGNPPYIDADDPHLMALRHEPQLALTPGADGLAAIRQIAAAAPGYLRDDGWLLLEHGQRQHAAVAALLAHHGLVAVATRVDLAANPRCTGGRWALLAEPRIRT